MKVLLISIVLVAIALVLLATGILLKKVFLNKQGHFPITSVGHNPEMRKLGITCAKGDAWREFREAKKRQGCSSDELPGSCCCG